MIDSSSNNNNKSLQNNRSSDKQEEPNSKDSDENSGGIDLEKLNEGTRKKYNFNLNNLINDKANQDKDSEDSGTQSIDDEEGIKKSPLCEFDSPTKEMDIQFPDFYDIDIIDYIYTMRQEGLGAVLTGESKANENEIIMKTDKFLDVTPLLEMFKEKKIPSLISNVEFEIGNIVYQHKDEVYQGKFHPMNDDERNVFIKKASIRNKSEYDIVMREMKILFKLIFLNNSSKQNNPFINDLLYYYYDSSDRYLYTFFEGSDIPLINYIMSIESKDIPSEDIIKEKLEILSQMLSFVVMLHSNNILHRDLRMEAFYYINGYPKTFDFANAYQMNIDNNGTSNTGDLTLKRNVTHFQDTDFVTQVPKIQNELEESGLFLTPKYVSPELTSMSPSFGYGQDIWALACMSIEIFIKYSDYQEEMISRLLNRIFRGDDYLKESMFGKEDKVSQDGNSSKNKQGAKQNDNNEEGNQERGKTELKYAIPKIPKSIPKEIAQVIATCFYVQPINRPNIITLIDKFNIVFKNYGVKTYDVPKYERILIENMCVINELIYKNIYNKKTMEVDTRWNECPYHKGSYKNYYCETCNDFFCDNSIVMAHKEHMYEVLCGTYKNTYMDKEGHLMEENVKVEELLSEKTMLKGYQVDLEKLEMEKNFKIIEEFSQSFECDYESEKERINSQYEAIMKKINDLEKTQLQNLDQAKEKFELNFQKIFSESQRIEDFCNSLYSTKSLFFSHLNRLNSSLKNRKVNSLNYPIFRKKLDKFLSCASVLRDNGTKLKKKCDSFKITGKYIFRHELYTDEFYKYLKSLELKINTEKMKFFDYSDSDSLFLTRELIMIIPLTSCVFSYSKNSYKKFKVDFEKNNVKLNSFLPGSATLHQGPLFYVTGGEIKDEATSNFIMMNIDEKVIYEKTEMNYPRRFHTMLGIETRDHKFIMAIGGWDCNEVEYINSEELNKWVSLPSMHFKRSDPTAYLFDNKYVYIFGGWDYSQKKCIGEVERYQILFSNNDDDLITNGQWEMLKIKGETISLQKYNMGLIALTEEKSENSEKIILVGGFDESYDYSQSVIKIEIMQKENSIFVNKDIKGLPTGGESSFWYEKQFHVMNNDLDGEMIAVNFNCFNNIYVYTYRTNEFKQYANSTSKN